MRTILCTLLLATSALPALAQSSVVLAPGSRVWVRTMTSFGRLNGGVKGTVLAISGDTLYLAGPDSGTARPVPVDSRSRVFVATGTRSGRASGVGFGLIVGALVGTAVGARAEEDCSSEFLCFSGLATATGVARGGVVGMLVGAVVGSTFREDIWTPLNPPPRRATLLVAPGGEQWRVGVRVSFE